MSKKAAEHHRKASEHSTHAAKHHAEAAKHQDAGQHEKAAQRTQRVDTSAIHECIPTKQQRHTPTSTGRSGLKAVFVSGRQALKPGTHSVRRRDRRRNGLTLQELTSTALTSIPKITAGSCCVEKKRIVASR
jgi:hypothetical protein